MVTGGFPDSVGALACNTGPNGHDAGNFGCNQGVDAGHVIPVAYRTNAAGQVDAQGDVSAALTSNTDPCTQFVAFAQNVRDEVRLIDGDGQIVGALSAEPGTHQTSYLAFDTTQVTSKTNRSNPQIGDPCHTLAKEGDAPAIAFCQNQNGDVLSGSVMHSIGTNGNATGRNSAAVAFEPRYYTRDNKTGGQPSDTAVVKADASKAGDSSPHVATGMQVRRLMPVECCRLQGVPDDHFNVLHNGKPLADGPKYKLIGNGFAIPVVSWIGKRIQMIEDMLPQDEF